MGRSDALRCAALLACFAVPCALPWAGAQPARPSAEAIAAEARFQQVYALKAFVADIDRIERVAYPLLRAASPYCGGRRQWSLGATPRSSAQLPATLRDAAPELGLGDRLVFTLVLPDTPVARAGVQPGDALLAINGQAVPAGLTAQPWFFQAVNRLWQQTRQPLQLGLQRGAQTVDVAVAPQTVCSASLRYVLSDVVNAVAGVNRQLQVSSGMLRFAADDAELAVVLGHELAHEVLGHPDAALKAAQAASAAAPALPASAPRDPYRQDKELDADQLGLYLTAAAGFDITRAAELWRRMAARSPSNIQGSFGASHPSSPERFLLLQAVAAEVAERQRRGDTLVPPLADLGLRQEVRASAASAAATAEPTNPPPSTPPSTPPTPP